METRHRVGSRRRKEPQYLHHRSRGQAYCWVYEGDRRRMVYLGPWNSPQSHRRFKEVRARALLAEANEQPLDLSPEPESTASWTPTVGDLVPEFLDWAERYYLKDGEVTGEYSSCKAAAAPLIRLYSDIPTKEFGFAELESVREEMIRAKWTRRYVNRAISRLRRIFKWGVTRRVEGVQLVPPTVHHELTAVAALRPGQGDVRERPPVEPVEPRVVEKVLPHLSPSLADMVRLQLATGMRPGEVCQLRWADVDTSGEFWLYRPRRHKTQHLEKDRVVPLGPAAQAILKKYLSLDREKCVFTPLQAVKERNCEARASRKSKVPPSQQARDARAKHDYRETWDTDSYRRVIARACRRAKVEVFAPNRLRHTFATLAARKGASPDEIAAMLGHAKIDTARHYVERNTAAAVAAHKRLGTG